VLNYERSPTNLLLLSSATFTRSRSEETEGVKIPTSNPFIQRFISENQEYARGILITVIQNTSNKFTLHHYLLTWSTSSKEKYYFRRIHVNINHSFQIRPGLRSGFWVLIRLSSRTGQFFF
jgi:hypothetical protein